MTTQLRSEYSNRDINRFEFVTGLPVDFTLTHAWARGAEVSRYARSVRAAAFEGENPVAIAQGTVRNRLGFRKLLCGSTSGEGVNWQSGFETAAVRCLKNLISRSRPSYLEVFSHAPLNLPRVVWRNAYSFQIHLLDSIEVILRRMHKEARYAMRKARRLGVSTTVFEDDAGMRRTYDLVFNAGDARNFPLPPRTYLYALHREFAKSAGQACVVASRNGELLSAASLIGYGRKVAWWKGGSTKDGFRLGAGNLVQVAAIEWAKERGFDLYDLGGTDPHSPKYAGIHRFKASLGGDLVTQHLGTSVTMLGRVAVKMRSGLGDLR